MKKYVVGKKQKKEIIQKLRQWKKERYSRINEGLESQVKRLGDFIFENIPKELIPTELPIDTAIRIIQKYINLKEEKEIEDATWKY